MTTIQVPAVNKARRFNWPRIFGYDFFISFKLGPPPIGAQSYASDLARRLRELDFTVFYSEEEAPPGVKLDTTLLEALHRSRILVVVANEGALVQSLWVRKEVEEFRRKHPKRPIIPINVNRAIERHGPQVEVSHWLDPDGSIWLDEIQDAVAEGIVSPEVLTRLQIVPRFTKANTWFRRMVATVILILIGLASWAGYEAWDANRKFKDATALRLLAESESMISGLRDGGTVQGLFKILAANKMAHSVYTDEALQTEYLKFSRLIFIRDNPAAIKCVVFSRDGTRIASGSGDALRIWNTKTGQLIPPKKPIKVEGEILSLALNSDGTRIIIGSDSGGIWRIWDTITGDSVSEEFSEKYWVDWVSSVAFSPNDVHIVNSSGSTPSLRVAKTGQLVGELTDSNVGDVVFKVAFSSDGTRIIFATNPSTTYGNESGRGIRLWDVNTSKFIGKWGYQDKISDVALNSKGTRIAIGSSNGILRILDADTGIFIGESEGHGESISSIAFSPDDASIVAITKDGTLRKLNANTGNTIDEPLKGFNNRVSSISFSPSGFLRIVTGSEDGSLGLWNDNVEPNNQFSDVVGNAPHVAFNRCNDRIGSIQGDRHTLRLWDANIGLQLAEEDYVSSFAFSPDRSRIVFGKRGSWETENLQLLDTKSGKPIILDQPMNHQAGVDSVAFSPDGTRIVSGGIDGTLQLWNAKTGKPIGKQFKEHDGGVDSVDFSPNGDQILTSSHNSDDSLKLWNLNTDPPIGQPLKGHTRTVYHVKFSPDGDRIAGIDDGILRLWDVNNLQPIDCPYKTCLDKVTSFAFSLDGTIIVSGNKDGFLGLWNIKNGLIDRSSEHHDSWVSSVTFSPNGERMVSRSADDILRFWDSKTFKPFGKRLRAGSNVSFSRDGSNIVSSENGDLRRWPVFGGWADDLCKKLGRNMTHQEWRNWVSPDIDYIEQCPVLPIPPDEPETTTTATEQTQP